MLPLKQIEFELALIYLSIISVVKVNQLLAEWLLPGVLGIKEGDTPAGLVFFSDLLFRQLYINTALYPSK